MSILSFFRKRPSPTAPTRQPLVSPLVERISWVAEGALSDAKDFKERARQVAIALVPSAVDQLVALLHDPSDPPKRLGTAFSVVTQWRAVWHFSIFEVLYNIGAPSLPAVRSIAFGEYDWIQGNAIELLCRFAADGIERTTIIDDLVSHLPEMRYEAHAYALQPLIAQAGNNPALQCVIDQLLVVPEVKEVYQELKNKQGSA